MKVLFVNTLHNRGGAAVAVGRIMDALEREGVETRLLLLEPKPGDSRTVPNPRFLARHYSLAKFAERIPALAYGRRWKNLRHLEFSPSLFPWDSSDAVNGAAADLVHLHWINHGHLSPEGIGRIARPLVWTAHDMWPVTGGCHHSDNCERFQEHCGNCPVLGSNQPKDWSYRLLERKRDSWADRNLSLVCPSNWLAQRAKKSMLFRNRPISVIPNPLDLDVFSPGDQLAARARFGLPPGAPLVLFGAHKGVRNPAKGFSFLDSALAALAARSGAQKPHLAIIGAEQSQREQVKADIPVHFLGVLDGAETVHAYRAADLFVLPSLHETLPNMVAEALACGLPVVAFDIGGLAEMVDHGRNGYLARPFDAADLLTGIASSLELSMQGQLREAARAKAEMTFDSRQIAQRYLEVYRKAVAGMSLFEETRSMA